MKPTLAAFGLTLALCTMAFAQEISGDRIVVPPASGNRPRVVNCNLLNGTITVRTHASGDVIVEGEGHTHEEHQGGMHRIGVSSNGLEAVVDDNVITIHDRNGNSSIFLTVPVNTSLKLKTLSGGINVEGVNGEVEVHTSNGQVNLNNISGTVTADSQNGEIKVSMDRVDPSKPMAFSTLNGQVDLTLPADLKADLTVKSNHGAVYSDFDVTLGGSRAVRERNGNSYQIRIDNTIRGSINGGGVDLTIHTLNGAVYIRKKK
jgi:Putative adhesin